MTTSDYDSREDRAALERELGGLPAEKAETPGVSTVVSVRLRADELAVIEAAAAAIGTRIGTFIRRSAVEAATHPQGLNLDSVGKEIVAVGESMARLVETVDPRFRVNVERVAVPAPSRLASAKARGNGPAGRAAVKVAKHAAAARKKAVAAKKVAEKRASVGKSRGRGKAT